MWNRSRLFFIQLLSPFGLFLNTLSWTRLNVFIFPINVFIRRVQPVKNDTPYLNSEFYERIRGHVVVRVIVNAGFVKREYFGPRIGADEAMDAVERGHFDTGGQFVEI
jgi:hypothetical protein